MPYLIATGNDTVKLAGRVNELLRQGWVLQGGVSGFYNLSGYHYLQAMSREGA